MDNPFWQFSLAVYAAPGVAAECLALQEQYGADINVLLLAAWLAARQAALTARDIAAIRGHVGIWHEQAVKPLRGVRRYMKDVPDGAVAALRARIKAAELEAEQVEQAMLFAYARDRWPDAADSRRPDVVQLNIEVYLRALGYDGLGGDALPCANLCAATLALSPDPERAAMGQK